MSDCVSHGFDSIALSETCACAQDCVRCVRASVRVQARKDGSGDFLAYCGACGDLLAALGACVVTFSPH